MSAQCNCNEHYLELTTIRHGEFVHNRMCYKCGKWWVHTNAHSLPRFHSSVCPAQHITVQYDNLLVVDSRFYELNKDGTIKREVTGLRINYL